MSVASVAMVDETLIVRPDFCVIKAAMPMPTAAQRVLARI